MVLPFVRHWSKSGQVVLVNSSWTRNHIVALWKVSATELVKYAPGLVAPGDQEASRKLHLFGTASSTENAPIQFHSPIVFLPIDNDEY